MNPERQLNTFDGAHPGMGGFKEGTPGFSEIKEIRMVINESEIDHILRWAVDRETSLHLDPPPINPEDVFNADAVAEARRGLREYYEDPNIIPFLAVDHDDNPIAVVSMRPEGDEFIKNQSKHRTPVLERLIVDPNRRRQGIGADLSASAISYMFKNFRGYADNNGTPKGAACIYAWAMQKGDWRKNIEFFQSLGFDPIGSWRRYAIKNGHAESYKDNAFFFALKSSWFNEALAENPRHVIIPVNPNEGITNNAALPNERIA